MIVLAKKKFKCNFTSNVSNNECFILKNNANFITITQKSKHMLSFITRFLGVEWRNVNA